MKSTIKKTTEVLGTNVREVSVTVPVVALPLRRSTFIAAFSILKKNCTEVSAENTIKRLYDIYTSFGTYANSIEDEVVMSEYSDEEYEGSKFVLPIKDLVLENGTLEATHQFKEGQVLADITVDFLVTREVAYILYKLQKQLTRLQTLATSPYAFNLDYKWYNPALLSGPHSDVRGAVEEIKPFIEFFNEFVDCIVEAFFLPNV